MPRVPSNHRLADACNSICIITLVRIKVTTDITAKNASDKYALITLLTCVEQSLGVVNACLPVSKPVFDRLRSSSLISAISGWTSIKRGATSRDHGWPNDDQPNRTAREHSPDSTTNLPGATWSPPLSPRNGFE